MSQFFVVYTVWDPTLEISDTYYRCVIEATDRASAHAEAKLLLPNVERWADENHPRPLLSSDLEITVKPLDEWVAQLVAARGTLDAYGDDADAEDDDADND